MEVTLTNDWKEILTTEFQKDYFKGLKTFVEQERKNHTIFPPKEKVFSAFDHCPLGNLRLVIIGQDPYHGKHQANGLSFSVSDDIKLPPSLRNIYKEYYTDLGIEPPFSGNLEPWAKQGVLLLNATLTVREKTPGSHQKKGWEQFTDAIIQSISDNKENIIFILWGAYAQKKGQIIDGNKHFIIKSPHPSPFSAHRGFFGSKPFSRVNNFLKELNLEPIHW